MYLLIFNWMKAFDFFFIYNMIIDKVYGGKKNIQVFISSATLLFF